jgi:hypothetical protein
MQEPKVPAGHAENGSHGLHLCRTATLDGIPRGGFSVMSIRFSQGKLQGAERKSVLQEVRRQAKAAAIMAIKPVLASFTEWEKLLNRL